MDRTVKASNKIRTPVYSTRRVLSFVFLVLLIAFTTFACNVGERRSIPADAQGLIDRVTENIAEGHAEKVYAEAAEEWRRDATEEQTREILTRIRDRLGRVESRSFHSGQEQQSASGDLPGHTLTVTYETKFARANGMETFTLVERDGGWQLARYFVNSDALK